LGEELEGRKEKLCQCCKKFGHLARNCRSKREREKREVTLVNKFEMLSSRVMQCGVEERTIRRYEVVVVKCFKYGEKEHKCRECPLWKKKERVARMAKPQKAHQQKGPAHPEKGKAQKGEKRLRRVEEEEAACVAKSQEAQQEYVTNFIQLYLYQFFIDSHGLNGYRKPLKRPFDKYQSRLDNGRDISRSTGNHHGTVY